MASEVQPVASRTFRYQTQGFGFRSMCNRAASSVAEGTRAVSRRVKLLLPRSRKYSTVDEDTMVNPAREGAHSASVLDLPVRVTIPALHEGEAGTVMMEICVERYHQGAVEQFVLFRSIEEVRQLHHDLAFDVNYPVSLPRSVRTAGPRAVTHLDVLEAVRNYLQHSLPLSWNTVTVQRFIGIPEEEIAEMHGVTTTGETAAPAAAHDDSTVPGATWMYQPGGMHHVEV